MIQNIKVEKNFATEVLNNTKKQKQSFSEAKQDFQFSIINTTATKYS